MTDQLEKVKAFFAKDRFAMENGIEIIAAEPGYAKCRCPILPRHLNAGGTVQGGMVFTLGDFCFAVAANCMGNLTVSLDNTISFHRPAKGNLLLAEAKVVSSGKTTCFYQVSITDDLGTQVATMTATGYQKGENHIFD